MHEIAIAINAWYMNCIKRHMMRDKKAFLQQSHPEVAQGAAWWTAAKPLGQGNRKVDLFAKPATATKNDKVAKALSLPCFHEVSDLLLSSSDTVGAGVLLGEIGT